ncbi:CPBP family intramembrane glutamic endopeptidase [Lactobacillus isalae]|uniref:CPBP family intramembrane glutamic endopeptidase n=2 Tax=Lactobacillus TaxID=1578 RepID=UPI0024A8B1D1|nr:CPBP family intramembrane glutamic endopeptidase [Lactobacillus isalae]
MKNFILSHKRWQQIFDVQLLIALIGIFLEVPSQNKKSLGILIQGAFFIIVLGLNLYSQKVNRQNVIIFEIVRWLNLFGLSTLFPSVWVEIGNYFLKNVPQLEILWVLLLWMSYLVLLLPLAILFVGTLKNWFLRLIGVGLLGTQYGPDSLLKISKNLPWLHSITSQGVIAALALLILACFLGKEWGFHFNPNLKFVKSRSFQYSVLILLILFASIDVFYNAFINYDKQIYTAFFKYSIDLQKKYFTIASFTSALEPGILEETERYLAIIILLAGFKRYRSWRVPIAIYGSALLFGLSHLGNIGWNGETFEATIAQVIGVMGSGFLWAVLYLYSGKLWLPMIFHFWMDYLANLQTGWNSAGWQFNGWATDYISEVLMVLVPLVVTIWMMYGKRRELLEENADRLMNVPLKKLMVAFN